MDGQVIQKHFSTKKKITGGKVLVQWRGDNIEDIETELLKVLKSVQKSKTNTTWLTKQDYAERDAEEAKRKAKTKRGRSVFSLKIG